MAADRLRTHSDAVARWSVERASWLRCVADGLEAGAIDPCSDLWWPGEPPSAEWTRSRRQVLAWLEQHGLPPEPPEAFLKMPGCHRHFDGR